MTGQELLEIIESGRAWNAYVCARPGNPENEKAPRRWSGRPQWSSQDQEEWEAEKERRREAPDQKADQQVQEFMARCREKHRAYWEARPHGGTERFLFK